MEVEDVVADRDVVVFAGVEDREFGARLGEDGFGASEVVGADAEHFCTGFGDFRVVVLQLT